LEDLDHEYSQAEQIVKLYRTDRGHPAPQTSTSLVEELRPILARLHILDQVLRACHQERRQWGLVNTPEQQQSIERTMRRLNDLLEQVNAAAEDASSGCRTLMPHLSDEGARQKMLQAYPQSNRQGSSA
jgi:hypothetical protein